MDTEIYSAIISAVVAFITSALFITIDRSRQRKQNTFQLYIEFNSKELLFSRVRTNNLLKAILESENLSWTQLRHKLSDDFEHISRVGHFFDAIQSLIDSRMIDEKLAKSLFLHYFVTFDRYFSKIYNEELNLPAGDRSRLLKRLNELGNKWIRI